jgi:hypothetical protein
MAVESNLRVDEFSLFLTLKPQRRRTRCVASVTMAPNAFFNSQWMGVVLQDGRGGVFRRIAAPTPGPLSHAGSSFGATGSCLYEFLPPKATAKPYRLIVFFLGEVATYRVGQLKAGEYPLISE